MMAHQKQLLYELLKEDQEPFHLNSYIADRRSLLKKPSPSTTLQLRKRKPIVPETSTKRSSLCKHVCFLSFQNSAEVRKSPFRDFPLSPAQGPCKSPNGAVYLHIPSRTAALLVEAAMRIQKQQQWQSKPRGHGKNARFGLFGSFLKRLKDRSKNKKRAISDNDFKAPRKYGSEVEDKVEEAVRISCSCSNRRLSSADWTENNEDKSLDFEASTSCGSECSDDNFGFTETRFCTSPFRFSFHRSPSSNGRGTPDFSSPAASPGRHVKKQDKENYESRNPDKVRGEAAEKEKEQSSPISVLDSPFQEDDGRESGDAEGDNCDLQCSYANVQRAKEQLLYRLQRFEKLAELDPTELERKLLEGSDNDNLGERDESEDYKPLSPCNKPSIDTFVTEVFNQSIIQCPSVSMSNDMKKLVCDLIVEENGEIINSGSKEVVVGRICNRLDSWKDVELDTIDMMIGLDLKKECDGWTRFAEQVEETAAEIELAVFELLVDELSEELFSLDGHNHTMNKSTMHPFNAHDSLCNKPDGACILVWV